MSESTHCTLTYVMVCLVRMHVVLPFAAMYFYRVALQSALVSVIELVAAHLLTILKDNHQFEGWVSLVGLPSHLVQMRPASRQVVNKTFPHNLLLWTERSHAAFLHHKFHLFRKLCR